MNNSELIISKLKEYYNFKSDAKLARFLEVPATTLASWKTRDSIDKEFLYAKCEGISAEFLQTGKGKVFKELENIVNEENGHYGAANKIPLFDDVISIGGINERVADLTPSGIPAKWIDVSDLFPGATSAIIHYGDSMLEYPSASILILREVKDKRLLVWGKNYCIETTEFRITKQLQDGGVDNLVGYSTNKDTYPDGKQIHSPVYIPKDETLLSIHKVLGCITREESNGIMLLSKEK